MIKALSAIAVAAFIATALTVLPGFAPTVEASVPQALAKADRLDIRAGRQGLLAAGLAELRSFLPARCRHQGSPDPRSPSGYRRPYPVGLAIYTTLFSFQVALDRGPRDAP